MFAGALNRMFCEHHTNTMPDCASLVVVAVKVPVSAWQVGSLLDKCGCLEGLGFRA